MSTRRRRSPYKFLDAYGLHDSARFFARDLEIDLLLSDVIVSRLVVLFAKTGTGKTSLINAGVRPLLLERGYRSYLIRIRDDPFESTRSQLHEQTRGKLPAGPELSESLRGLVDVVKQPVVLFFDQFEEFFLYAVQQDIGQAQRFVDLIADLYDDEDAGIHVVFSMREEWFVDMGIFRDRIPAIFHNDSNLRLRWFTAAQAREAIEGPAGQGAYDPAVVDLLVKELSETSRAVAPIPASGDVEPAQLQVVCDTLWRRARGWPISLEDYRALGDGRRPESTAQQILDRRLVEQFEKLDRDQLDLLVVVLPELRTAEGTKRVRQYTDLVSALISNAATTVDILVLQSLLEALKAQGFIDLLPRPGGEIVELTHDYLAVRLGEMADQIALIWPRKALAEGMILFRKGKELLRSDVVADVVAAVPKMRLDTAEGELVLRSALGHLVELHSALPVLLASGAPVWDVFEERIAQGAEAERVHAIRSLIEADSQAAFDVLRGCLRTTGPADELFVLLARATTSRAVDLLVRAALDERHSAAARSALAELASTPGFPSAAVYARDQLRKMYSDRLSSWKDVPEALAEIAELNVPFSVVLLAEAMIRPELALQASARLADLTASTDRLVAARAREALPGLALRDEGSSAASREVGSVTGIPSQNIASEPPTFLGSHLDEVVRLFATSRIVPWLGLAAFRANSGSSRPERQLADYLAARCDYPPDEPPDLTRVASYFSAVLGPSFLDEEMSKIIRAEDEPSRLERLVAHLVLSSRAPVDQPTVLLTTSFGNGLERAFLQRDARPYVLTYRVASEQFSFRSPYGPSILLSSGTEKRPLEGIVSSAPRIFIVRLYGGLEAEQEARGSYVLTQDDLARHAQAMANLSALPTDVEKALHGSTALLLGVDLRSRDTASLFGQLFRDVRLRSSYSHSAVAGDASRVDIGLWQSRRVNVIPVPIDEYTEQLAEFFGDFNLNLVPS